MEVNVSFPELDRAMETLEHALEHLHGQGARRLVLRRVQEVLDRQYPPAVMLDTAILGHVRAHPGICLRDLRDGVGRRASDVGASVRRLLRSGRLADRGGDAGRSLYVLPGPRPQGNAGNGQGATNVPGGYLGEGLEPARPQRAPERRSLLRVPVSIAGDGS